MKAFRKITLPLAAPGIVAAFLFVFIPSIGEYITPSLVGGTKGYMFGQAVADHFVGGAFDWQGGSVLALFLLAGRAVPDRDHIQVPARGRRHGMSTQRSERSGGPCVRSRMPCEARNECTA